MMTNAFELAGYAGHAVPGSRGSLKQASIVSMSAIREARGTILAMLEAFLYDPLLSWTVSGISSLLRLINNPTNSSIPSSKGLD